LLAGSFLGEQAHHAVRSLPGSSPHRQPEEVELTELSYHGSVSDD
jgi:hypothetical protein